MSQAAESPAPQGSETAKHVELPKPTIQPEEEVAAARADEPRPNLDQRQAAIRTERRAAGPDLAALEDQDALEDERPEENNESPTDPAESPLE